jgi:hypothetical protein
MSLTSVFETLSRGDLLADFNLHALEGQSTMGRREEIRLMALPFFRNVQTNKMPDSDWLAALMEYGIKPNVITDHAEASRFTSVSMTPKFQAGDPFFQISRPIFAELYSKEFLLFGSHDLTVPYAVRAEDFDHQSAFLDGLLVRKSKSAQGSKIRYVKSGEALDKTSLEKDDIIVEYFTEERIDKNIEVVMSFQDNQVQVLGLVEIITKKFRKVGAKSIRLCEFEISQIKEAADRIASVLTRMGVQKLYFGFDAFFIRQTNQASRLVIYDFNPCITQGFFPILAQARLENKWGKNFEYEVRAFSMFSNGIAPLPFDWSQAFPLLVSRNVEKGVLFSRYIVIGLFLCKKGAESESPALLWAERLKSHKSGLLHSYAAIHY